MDRILKPLIVLLGLPLLWGAAVAAPQPASAIALAPAIAPAPPTAQARGTFFTQTVQVDLASTQIRLAATPDGSGALCTDDEATVSFIGPRGGTQRWSHLFAATARQAVRCLAPPLITLVDGPGVYTITVTLTDRYADTYSSQPYYLLPVSASAPSSAAPLPTSIATVRSTQPVRPSATPHASPSPTPRLPTPTSAVTVTATATPTVRAAPEAVPPASSPPNTFQPAPPWPLVLALMLGAALLAALGLLLLRGPRPARRRGTALSGILDLTDRETGEARSMLLYRYATGVAISRKPLAVAAWPVAEGQPPPLLAIVPTAGGPVLRDLAAQPAPTTDVPLRAGDELLVQQALTVRYRRT